MTGRGGWAAAPLVNRGRGLLSGCCPAEEGVRGRHGLPLGDRSCLATETIIQESHVVNGPIPPAIRFRRSSVTGVRMLG